jgi:serine/threonine protein kinase
LNCYFNFEDEKKEGLKFSDYYKYIKTLGKGSFGLVISAIDLKSNEKCALKVNNIIYL